jgi:hypothetical protein
VDPTLFPGLIALGLMAWRERRGSPESVDTIIRGFAPEGCPTGNPRGRIEGKGGSSTGSVRSGCWTKGQPATQPSAGTAAG